VVTTVIGVTLLLVSAAVFAITTATARIAGDSRELHQLDETLRVVTIVRANVANAVHFASLDRNTTYDIGDAVAVSVDSTRSALASLDSLLADEASPQLTATRDFAGLAMEIVALVEAGDPAAQPLAEDRLVSRFGMAKTEIEGAREASLRAIVSADGGSARTGDLARFAVSLVVPLAIVLLYREIISRQFRQRELELRLEAEQELGKARDEFVANTSHELRTPLTAIIGLGQMVEMDPELTEDTREMLGMMNSEANDLARMVEDLLTTSRLAAGQLRFEPREVAAKDEAEAVSQPFAQNGHIIKVDVEEAKIWVDRLRLRQVLRNLLSNAIKYGGGTLELRGWVDGDQYEWMVVDDGPGIPKELEARLFQRYIHSLTFQQAVVGGVGLGLSIVKSLVEGMGGEVSYRRVLGETIFAVRVPLAKAVPAATKRAAEMEPISP
jgi:signal transduction histidine kinase